MTTVHLESNNVFTSHLIKNYPNTKIRKVSIFKCLLEEAQKSIKIIIIPKVPLFF